MPKVYAIGDDYASLGVGDAYYGNAKVMVNEKVLDTVFDLSDDTKYVKVLLWLDNLTPITKSLKLIK